MYMLGNLLILMDLRVKLNYLVILIIKIIILKGYTFFIGDNKEKVTISSYRHHKMFDMFLFDEYNYINDVLKFKGSKVYIDREEVPLKDGELFISDYIGMDAYFENKFIGKVSDIIDNNGYKLFVVNNKYIPFNKEFIKLVSKKIIK